MKVTFQTADLAFTVPDKQKLSTYIAEQCKRHGIHSVAISYIFCSDEYIINLNRTFLSHDYYTDILTFPLSVTKTTIEAEIYISVDTVASNATKYGQSFATELHRVIFHGVLHLLDYNDSTKKEKAEMRATEDKWLSEF